MPDHAFMGRMIDRVTDLVATDAGFAAAMPDGRVNAALDVPGLRMPQIIWTLIEGYAQRPALGERAVEFVTDAAGRTTAELQPRFEFISYRELGDRVSSAATGLGSGGGMTVRSGDRVCILGFASSDYATVDLALVQIGAVAVSLPTAAPVAQLLPIVTETEPSLIASSVEYLDDAVELALTAHAPEKIVVFDYREPVDEHRQAVASARARLADARSSVTSRP